MLNQSFTLQHHTIQYAQPRIDVENFFKKKETCTRVHELN